jgi:hypothetical protein
MAAPWQLTEQERRALSVVLILCALSLIGLVIF